MNETTDNLPVEQSRRRILVGCDCHTQYPHTLSNAINLAAKLRAELAGLFVENSQLLDMASLPYNTEVIGLGGEKRAVDTSNMARSMRALARQMKTTIEQLATLQQISYSFDVVQGELITAMINAARGHDLMVLHSDLKRHIQQLDIRGRLTPHEKPVIVLIEPGDRETLSIAAQLALSLQQPLLLLVLAESDTIFNAASAECKKMLLPLPFNYRLQRVTATDTEQLAQLVILHSASAVVLKLNPGAPAEQQLSELMSYISSTLFILR